jgi:NTE family protein
MAQEPALKVVQLVYRQKPHEGDSKDYEFSRQTMLDHWAAGVADVKRYLDQNMADARPGRTAVVDPGLGRETVST